jgi:hypothetical protein
MFMSVGRMVTVFDGRWGEDIAETAASGVDGASATLMVGTVNGVGLSSEVTDELSSSAAMVDEEPQLNAGPSTGTAVFPTTAMSSISAESDVGSVVTSLPHALRQVTTVEGHPPFGTNSFPNVMSQ